MDDVLPLEADPRLPLGVPFSRAQAAAVGLDRNRVGRMLRAGHLRRVFRGVYVDAGAEDTLLSRAQALRLVVPPSVVVTEELSAWVRGVDLLRRGDHLVPPPLTVSQPLDRTRVRKHGTAGSRRMLEPRDVEVLHGVRRTTSLRTAVDLGRKRHRVAAIGAVDALLHTGDFTRGELLDELARFRGFRGVVQLRALAAVADARAESPAESAMRLLWIDAGLPPVTTQIPVLDARGAEVYRLDLGLPEIRYAAEYDGTAWHSSPEQRAHDRRRRAVLAEHGWVVDVLGKREVFERPDLAVAVFRAGIARAGGRLRRSA
jgi:Transcriptional regulator, AbiEi antitoxin